MILFSFLLACSGGDDAIPAAAAPTVEAPAAAPTEAAPAAAEVAPAVEVAPSAEAAPAEACEGEHCADKK